MSDYLARLSGFDAVMGIVALGALGIAVYLLACVRRLNRLAPDQLADELAAAARLSPEEVDMIRRVADRLRRDQDASPREDNPA